MKRIIVSGYFNPLHGGHLDLFEAAAKAIDAAKPKTTGLASKRGFSGSSIEHEAVLRRTWEMLCKS